MVLWGCIIFFVLLLVINAILSCKLAGDADDKAKRMFSEYKEKNTYKEMNK